MNNCIEKGWSPIAVVDIAEYAVALAITLVTMVGLLRFLGFIG